MLASGLFNMKRRRLAAMAIFIRPVHAKIRSRHLNARIAHRFEKPRLHRIHLNLSNQPATYTGLIAHYNECPTLSLHRAQGIRGARQQNHQIRIPHIAAIFDDRPVAIQKQRAFHVTFTGGIHHGRLHSCVRAASISSSRRTAQVP